MAPGGFVLEAKSLRFNDNVALFCYISSSPHPPFGHLLPEEEKHMRRGLGFGNRKWVRFVIFLYRAARSALSAWAETLRYLFLN
jgi:hypothetical protein